MTSNQTKKNKGGHPKGVPSPGSGRKAAPGLPAAQWDSMATDLAKMIVERDRAQAVTDQRQAAIDHTVHTYRTAGASWVQIADVLGMHPHSVQRRYGKTTSTEQADQ